MIQFVCDRCGKTIDKDTSKKNYATYEIRKRNFDTSLCAGFILENPLDLCPDCYKSFSKWLKEHKADKEDKHDRNRES